MRALSVSLLPHGSIFITGQRFISHAESKAPILLTLHRVHDSASGSLITRTVRTGVCADGSAHIAVDKLDHGTVGGQECWPGKDRGPQRKETLEDICQPAAVET